MEATTLLRRYRLNLPVPPTLAEVAERVRAHGLRCTPGHLSNVESGRRRAGPKLRAVLAALYGKPRRAVDLACQAAEAQWRKNGKPGSSVRRQRVAR
jgi:hypothetical protein